MKYLIQLFTYYIVINIYHSHPQVYKGKFLEHDQTIIDCGKYKQSANQHSCVLTPFNPEGPYFLSDDLLRSKINESEMGKPLDLTIKIVDARNCQPLKNMFVHIWHANAQGIYSGVDNENIKPVDVKKLTIGGPGDSGMGPGGGRPKPINPNRANRGYQVTDSEGKVNFSTIIPGWYTGRCLHIHVEVFHDYNTEKTNIIYVTQIYFQRDLPYDLLWSDNYILNTNKLILNEEDGIFLFYGNQTMTDLVKNKDNENERYSASITFGIDPDALTKIRQESSHEKKNKTKNIN